MAHPGDVPSTISVVGNYLNPKDRVRGLLNAFSIGGVGLSDLSKGPMFQVWELIYIDDILDPDYGDLIVIPELVGGPTVIINVSSIVNLGFAFDQNMRIQICYELENGDSCYYWYDTSIPGFTTSQLPDGSSSPRMTLDDPRTRQDFSNDVILGYILGGTLYYRQQRERYDTPRVWAVGVGGGPLNFIGMMDNNRVGYDVGYPDGVTLCTIVQDVCTAVEMHKYDVTELCGIKVRGFLIAGLYSGADIIRSLQRVYFFDMPEIDSKLRCILRGTDIEATILMDDVVVEKPIDMKTHREQGVEFPLKLHVTYASAESDYTPTKQTSERRSPDVRIRSEIAVETAVNFEADEAAQRAYSMHNIAWNEQEGTVEFNLDESWWYLVPSNAIMIETYEASFRRVRITEMTFTEGVHEIKAVVDRKHAINSTVSGVESLPPTAPQPVVPGTTTWEFMDLPALLVEHDSLHAYVAARGEPDTGWHGAQIQRFIGADWQKARDVNFAEDMGRVEEAVASSDGYYIDKNGTILVSLNATPESISDDDMFSGRGAWLVGDEIIQVRDWVQEGDNWRGTYLFRGRLNTVPATHATLDRMVFLGNPLRIPLASNLVDTDLTMRAVSFDESTGTSDDYPFQGISQEEWPPEQLTSNLVGNDWEFSWIPRYALGNSANPIPHAQFYGWVLRFTAGGNTHLRIIETRTPEFIYTSDMQVEDFGSNQTSFTTVEIRGLNYLGGEGQALSEAVS